MKPKAFLQALDDQQIVAAIAAAEAKTSGEIRVYVSERDVEEVIPRAARRFEKLGMHQTRERNAVLLFFAPRAQKFAVIGDTGIHEKCGQAFWEEVAAEMRELLKRHEFTAAVVAGVAKVGEVLARHFPRASDDRDELSNEVLRD